MIKALRSLPEYKQLSRSVTRLVRLTVLNVVSDGDYDVDLIRREIRDEQKILTRSIREGSKQYKEWTDHSKLHVYTVVTYHDYEDDNSFHYYCVEGDRSEDYRAQNHRVAVRQNPDALECVNDEWYEECELEAHLATVALSK